MQASSGVCSGQDMHPRANRKNIHIQHDMQMQGKNNLSEMHYFLFQSNNSTNS